MGERAMVKRALELGSRQQIVLKLQFLTCLKCLNPFQFPYLRKMEKMLASISSNYYKYEMDKHVDMITHIKHPLF